MKVENRKIVLVANSPTVTDINDFLNDDDIVVRFNIPLVTTLCKTGEKTDILFLANTVDLMEDRLKKDSEFLNYLNNLSDVKVIFPYEDDLVKKINPLCKVVNKIFFIKFKKFINNWDNQKYISFFEKRGIDVEIVPESVYWDASEKLNLKDTSLIVSSGFLATLFFLNSEKYKEFDIYLHGFSFEGWCGHAWDFERAYISSLVKKGEIKLFL